MRRSRAAVAAVAAVALLAACGADATNEAPQASAAARQGEASAAPPAARPGPVTLVSCRQGGCVWERRLSRRTFRTSAGRELTEYVADIGESYHGEREPPGAYAENISIEWGPRRTTWVHCSTTKPLVAFQDAGDDLIAHYLDFYATAGYNHGSARTYMRTCHDRDFVEDEQVLRGLGYRPGTRNEQVEGLSVEELGG